MSKVRNLPEKIVIADDDIMYLVDSAAGPNAGKKVTVGNLKIAVVSDASAIPYNNSNSTLVAVDVRSAIDELDTKVIDHSTRHSPNGVDALTTAAPVTINADVSNSEGTASAFARSDHIHNIPTAAPSASLSAATSNAQGVASTFAKSDHSHMITSGVPSTQNADQANAAGTSANLAKADHIHNIPTAAPSSTGVANSQGIASTFAKSDHVHNTLVANTSLIATGDTTTVSTTDTLIDAMINTPAAGTYLVIFSTTTTNSGNGSQRNFISFYVDGVQVSGTERPVGVSGGSDVPFCVQAIVTVSGAQALEARWRVVAGTGTIRNRRMSIIRLG